MTQHFKKGEIRLANLNPGNGTEPGKIRPVLIIQSQALLDINHPSTIIMPLTTNLIENASPLRIRVEAQGKLKKNSDILIDQIRAIDNKRLANEHEPLTELDDEFMKVIYQCIFAVMDAYQLAE